MVVIEAAAVSPCGVSKVKSLFCRPAQYVWHNEHMLTADITSVQGQGCMQDPVISTTLEANQNQFPRLHLLASDQGGGRSGELCLVPLNPPDDD